jgi:hypothetical protein
MPEGELRRTFRQRRTVVCAAVAGIAVAALPAVTAGCAGQTPAAGPATGASGAGPVYNLAAARAEAVHLLGVVRLPPGARPSVGEPADAGVALSSYAVNVPVVPHLVDRHEFFVAGGTPASVIGWMQGHRPAGSIQDDSGGGAAGEQWTSFAFRSVRGFAGWPDLVVNAVASGGGGVAVRVDAQVAPRPRLPGTGRGPGDIRVVELGTMLGSFGYELRCGPAGGTVPDPARICAAIARDSALLYSFPGPGHSCPAGAATVSIAGSWNGKPLRSRFSVCTGGQEQQAGLWAGLLPSTIALGTVHPGWGIGLVSLGEREAAAVDLLRGPQRAPGPCQRCTRSFGAGYSFNYGGGPAQRAGWTVSFARGRVTRIESNVQLTVAGVIVYRGLASLRRSLPGWTIRTCGATRALVHSSPAGQTLVVYRGAAFQHAIVTTAQAGC